MPDLEPIDEDSSEAIDAIFFEKHGVGDVPSDPHLERIGHLLDKNIASLEECRFCRNIMAGDSKKQAYIKAFNMDGTEHRADYYATLANRVMKRPRVARKMQELQERAEALMDEDLSQMVHDLNEDRKLARALGQPSAAISATKTKAQMLGLMETKTVTNNVNVMLTDEQKEGLLGRIGENMKIIDADYEDVSE